MTPSEREGGSSGGTRADADAGEGLVRSMTQVDLDRVVEVEEASFSVPWSREAFERLLGRPEVLSVVVETGTGADRRPVGYVILWRLADEAELANIAVAPEARGHGLGGRLLDSVLERVRSEWPVRRIFLEVRRSDARAQRLYRTRGFRRLGLRRNYYRRPREDAVVMVRVMDASAGRTSTEEP